MIDIAREKSYPTPVAQSPLLRLLLLSLATQKNSPSNTKTPDSILPEYDFIVVGAGSAGATVASRLSEISCVNVLLLEAGGKPPLLNDVPAFGNTFWNSDLDWAYKTTPQKHTGTSLKNRQIIWPKGKGLGGSSLLNSLLVIRGNKKNYDDWARQGATGWSYPEVLPYFKKLEDNQNQLYVDSGYHGKGGPVCAQNIPYFPPLKRKVFAAAEEMGHEILDSNGPRQTEFDVQGSLRNGQRCHTGKAYLVPAENRTNLDILTHAFVHKVVIKNYKAVGVSFDVNGTMHEVKSRKEIIVSAGTINSAQLLMLSGIGPKDELEKHKIPVVADLPVGENLQDHCTAFSGFELNQKFRCISEKLASNRSILQYVKHRSEQGFEVKYTKMAYKQYFEPYAGKAAGFCNSQILQPKSRGTVKLQSSNAYDPPLIDPNYFDESQDLNDAYKQYFEPYAGKAAGFCNSQILQPKSRGTVKLQSSNAYDPPLIDPNYFDESQDLNDVIEGMKTCQKILASRAMRKIRAKPFNTTYPGCENFEAFSYEYYKCQALAITFSQSHEVGTVKMGNPNDRSTVVDPELRVKGIKGLRVVDASIMPLIPSGNTNIPTIMVAEKASDIIKGAVNC
nr:glucose dehydrogenase [FAD, quinone] [Parasteatoda tepidariorum]